VIADYSVKPLGATLLSYLRVAWTFEQVSSLLVPLPSLLTGEPGSLASDDAKRTRGSVLTYLTT
jgi:hypothetical protein